MAVSRPLGDRTTHNAVWGDFERLRQRAYAADEYAAERLADVLANRGDVKELRQLAGNGDEYAAERLADLLLEQGDDGGLAQLAYAGNEKALLWLEMTAADVLGKRDAAKRWANYVEAAAWDSSTVSRPLTCSGIRNCLPAS